MQKLVIVESPAKAKTIKKYLGPGFEVVASMGHIRDLPRSLLGVDLEHDFKPRYVDIPGKTALIRQLRALAAGSSEVLLATDPDREGEAISWHLAQLLGLDIEQTHRVTFNEITKTGVTQGIQNPRTLDMDLVDAQQARRILDRIVGYKLSPYLWQTVRKGLSAGRVQSATVNLIVQREEEISVFVSEEYWSIEALLSKTEKEKPFTAHFYGTKREKMKLANAEQTQAVFEKVSKAVFTVDDVKNGVKQLSPAPPFITSTLQQEASRKLTFAARRTMKAAQELYEGVDVEGVGMTGLITYMRTDSLRIS
ncbi:MAG: DNA topoisomerase, partial [Oscillospiraceae bacterium]|nr:DNA topoisomerase [Oscillospiraceae bacterium]